MDDLIDRKLKEKTSQCGSHSLIDGWSVVGVFQEKHLSIPEVWNRQLSTFTESSNIWAAATRVQLTLSTCSNVLSDIKLPQLMGEFTPDSNYTSGLFSFTQLTDIPLTSGGVRALEAPLWVSFYCSDWLSSPLSSLAAHKWGLIVFHLWGELCGVLPFQNSKLNRAARREKSREIHASLSISAVGDHRNKNLKIQRLPRIKPVDKC